MKTCLMRAAFEKIYWKTTVSQKKLKKYANDSALFRL